MRSNLAQHRSLILVIFFLFASILPARADTSSEALPVEKSPQAETVPETEAKKAVESKGREATEIKKENAPSTSTWEDSGTDEGPNDPLEPFNRMIFGINEVLDFLFIRPASEIYRAILPDPVRNGVNNFMDNIFAPVAFFNHVLQGEPERATVTLFRFLMNSTLGVAGLVDITTELGYPRYDTGFNQTLTAWGVDTGPYLVLPIIGSSSFRGGTGLLADFYADPLNLYFMNRHHWKYRYWLTVRYGLDMLRLRERVIDTIDNLRNSSPDMYVTMRSIYFQKQAYMAEKLKSVNTPEAAKEEGKSNTS